VSDEAAFRACLDPRGILVTDALASPSREEAFTVFAQRSDARIELTTWKRQAAQFFATDLGLTIDKAYDASFPLVDAARVVIVAKDGESGTRLCYGRPRAPEDLAAADDAERRVGYAGLADLAKRCATVWLVRAEADDDRVALRIAAILASVLLGPILAPRGEALFGVKTARVRLERPHAP
jgi:hypothetical protein